MSNNPPAACYIHGIGTAVPEGYLSCEQTGELLKKACINPRSVKLLQRIVRLTGIEKRHLAVLDHLDNGDGRAPLYRSVVDQPRGPGMAARTALFERTAGPLVIRALGAFSPEALSGVGTLVTVSCTHASSPGLERPILTHCPIARSLHRWNLGFMGCSAALAAVRLVHQTVGVNTASLIVACELSSLHFQYTDQLDQMTANLLFADGAAAMLLSPRLSPIQVTDCCCATFPESADEMVWFAGDHGLELRLSQDLPATLATNLRPLVVGFLRDHGMSTSDVDHWLIHPGGPQILDGVERSLALPNDALRISRSVFSRYGNMSSPTILFIMKELFDSKGVGRVVAVAFGPGLTIELVLLQISRAS